jgi:hypothetical protein
MSSFSGLVLVGHVLLEQWHENVTSGLGRKVMIFFGLALTKFAESR